MFGMIGVEIGVEISGQLSILCATITWAAAT